MTEIFNLDTYKDGVDDSDQTTSVNTIPDDTAGTADSDDDSDDTSWTPPPKKITNSTFTKDRDIRIKSEDS
jgi:hypothetical protein